MLTKPTDCQSVEKARKQGNFASGKICRRRRPDLTIPRGSANPPPEAKIASYFSYIRAIFAVVGFVSALGPRLAGRGLLARTTARTEEKAGAFFASRSRLGQGNAPLPANAPRPAALLFSRSIPASQMETSCADNRPNRRKSRRIPQPSWAGKRPASGKCARPAALSAFSPHSPLRKAGGLARTTARTEGKAGASRSRLRQGNAPLPANVPAPPRCCFHAPSPLRKWRLLARTSRPERRDAARSSHPAAVLAGKRPAHLFASPARVRPPRRPARFPASSPASHKG